jgi:hypothetical protein
LPLQPVIRQNAKVRALGFAWPCTKSFEVNAHSHSPSTARLAIKFAVFPSTCRARSPLCACTLFMHPATGVPKQKNVEFSSQTMFSARDAVDSGQGARALVRTRHVRSCCCPPVALCFAGGRGCCPLAPLPLSYRVPFLASWGNTRRENRLSFFPQNLLEKCWG